MKQYKEYFSFRCTIQLGHPMQQEFTLLPNSNSKTGASRGYNPSISDPRGGRPFHTALHFSCLS